MDVNPWKDQDKARLSQTPQASFRNPDNTFLNKTYIKILF